AARVDRYGCSGAPYVDLIDARQQPSGRGSAAERPASAGCPRQGAGCIVGAMPTRKRPADPTPDLFASASARANAPKQPTIARADAQPGDPAARPKYLLPKDLAGALERLVDAEVDSLLVAITAEAKRRGRPMPVSQRR